MNYEKWSMNLKTLKLICFYQSHDMRMVKIVRLLLNGVHRGECDHTRDKEQNDVIRFGVFCASISSGRRTRSGRWRIHPRKPGWRVFLKGTVPYHLYSMFTNLFLLTFSYDHVYPLSWSTLSPLWHRCPLRHHRLDLRRCPKSHHRRHRQSMEWVQVLW